jgi:DNA-binding transcriptional ArsR family regulator
MNDRALVEKKLATIVSAVSDLRRLARIDALRHDVREERFIEHTLQLAMQAALDVASHIVSDESLGEPQSNRHLFDLLARASGSLGGRADIVDLETLSWPEIHRARPECTPVGALVRGGFPELHANPEIDGTSFYNSYLATYLERDVRSLANVGSLREFERFLRACALRSANLLNKADLARDVGISPSTANQWLSVLEASGQVVLLEPHEVDRQESEVVPGRHRVALRAAEHHVGGRARAVAVGRPGVGDIRLRPTPASRAAGGARAEPVLLARPHPRSGLRRRSRRVAGVVRGPVDGTGDGARGHQSPVRPRRHGADANRPGWPHLPGTQRLSPLQRGARGRRQRAGLACAAG